MEGSCLIEQCEMLSNLYALIGRIIDEREEHNSKLQDKSGIVPDYNKPEYMANLELIKYLSKYRADPL